VISQNPGAGASVAAGSAVNLVVSTGPAPVNVPNVVGLTQAAATTAITNAGLVVGAVTQQPSNAVPAGSVISQNPSAGTSVAAGSAVDLVVSTGPGSAATPQELLRDLRTSLLAMNIRPGIFKSLDEKLANAIAVLDRNKKGSSSAAIGLLNSFVNNVEAQRDKAITDAQADELQSSARRIILLIRAK
jgi:hypothetical protein